MQQVILMKQWKYQLVAVDFISLLMCRMSSSSHVDFRLSLWRFVITWSNWRSHMALRSLLSIPITYLTEPLKHAASQPAKHWKHSAIVSYNSLPAVLCPAIPSKTEGVIYTFPAIFQYGLWPSTVKGLPSLSYLVTAALTMVSLVMTVIVRSKVKATVTDDEEPIIEPSGGEDASSIQNF